MTFLEQLVAEWYSFLGYYVRTNVMVGRREKGGWDGELDVVAFHPTTKAILHIETSMDALSWETRRTRYAKKFELGRKHIPDLFAFAHGKPKQIVVLGFPRSLKLEDPLGRDIEVLLIPELIRRIRGEFQGRKVETGAIPSQYPLLRAIQFALDYGGFLKD